MGIDELREAEDDLLAASAALASLATDNIPADVQELLVFGNSNSDIKPGALSRAMQAALNVYARSEKLYMESEERIP